MLLRKAFPLVFLASIITVFDANAGTFSVTRFDDTAATAGGSASGAGDGPGVSGDLRNTILLANSVAGSGNTINFVCLSAPATPCIITLNGPLPPITSNLTIDAGSFGNIIIDGNNAYRVFFVDTGTVALNHLEIQNANAIGGAGGIGGGPGGGGAGFGAGLFVNQATAMVTVQNTYFFNCNVTGGSGGNGNEDHGAGGGGLGFAGGAGTSAGAGGGGGVTGPGLFSASSNGDGGNGGPGGGGGGGAANNTFAQGAGGSGYGTNGGGSAGGGFQSVSGGSGGFGGGGGGGLDDGGAGGFGGGGGGGFALSAGTGGFGGGGGGTVNQATGGSSAAAVGGIQGGTGGGTPIGVPNVGGGGGGAAAGPAIFVRLGSVTLVNTTGATFAATAGPGGSAVGIGAGGGPGTANSTAVFNFGGSVNGSTATGAIAGALPGGLPATHLSLTVQNNPVQAFSQVDITVTALDINGNPATGYTDNVNFTSTEDPFLVYSLCQNNCPANNSNPPTTWTNGGDAWDFAPKVAGNFTIAAVDVNDASITGTSSTITCTPGPIVGLSLSGIPAAATAGTPFTFTVTAHDLFNNTETNNSTDSIAITSSDGAANLPAPATLANGVVSFSITLNTAGNETITATDATAAVSTTSPSINVTAMPPTLTAAFGASSIAVGASTSLTFTVTNPNAGTALTGVGFTDTLPAGLVVATPNGLTGSCGGGTITVVSGASSASLSGATLAASASCTFSINVKGTVPGVQNNVTSAVTSTNGGTGSTASASITVAGGAPTTTLAITSGATPVTTVASPTVVTLTATVKESGTPVSNGVVNFCDASATFCEDIHIVGSADLTSTGTAVLKFVPGIGSHSYKAVFTGTNAFPTSSSGASSLAVTGAGADVTSTAISQSGSTGNYTLTGTVTAFGVPNPSGQFSFKNQTNGNAVEGTANLDNATLASVFAPVQTVNEGANPYPLAIADLNGDGFPDAVVPNSNGANVSVFLGNGDGTFAAGVPYATGSAPASAAVGDFNGDGIPDIVVANYGDNTVSVLLGNGNGTFGTQHPFGTGSLPASVAVGDFDHDGILDLAVADYTGGPGSVSILIGNGDGTFRTAKSYTAGDAPFTVAVADFNGDGFPDVVTSSAGANNISVFLNKGDGTLQTQTSYPMAAGGTTAWSVTTGDFNGDGSPDIAVASAGNVSVLLNKADGSGTFNAAVGYTAGNTAYVIAAGDFNLDGIADLAVGNVNGGNISILTGSGTGTFAGPVNYSIGGGSPQGIAVADFNGDGRPDIGVPIGTVNKLGIFLGALTESGTAAGINIAAPGTQQVFASYPGDTNYSTSVSATTGLTGTLSADLTEAFGAGSITIGASTSMTFTVSNPNASPTLTGIAFTDTLPAGLVVSTPNGLSGSCGTITAVAGSSSVSMSGLSVAANAMCIFSVNVTGVSSGLQVNLTGAVTSNQGGTGPTASASITVNKDTQTISFGALPAHTYGDAPFTLNAAATSSLTVAFSVTSGPCSVTGTTLTITGAGSCVIAANQTGNATYSSAPAVPQTLTVNQAVLTVTANATKASGAPLPPLTATITGFVNGDTSAVVSGTPNLSTTATANSPVGTYPITVAAGTLAATNYSFSFVNGTLTVTAVTPPPAPAAPVVTLVFGANSVPVGGSTSLTFALNNPNLSQLTGIGFTDTLPAGLTLAAPNGLNGSCLSAGNVTAGGGSISLSGVSLAGRISCSFSVNVSAIAAGVQNDTTSSIVSAQTGIGTASVASVLVTQASQTIAFGPLPAHTYGDLPFAVSATATSSLPVAFTVTSGPCGLTSTTVSITGAGNCVITASQPGNTNYSAAPPVPQTITVGKATLTVTANSATIAAGAALPALTASFSGFVNGDTAAVIGGAPSVTTTATSSSPAGSYPIVVTAGTLTAVNYSFAFANGTLTITSSGTGGLVAIDNGATFGPGVDAPNTILTFFGTALSCTPNPQVLIDGSPSQILFANATQINFVVPGQIASGGASTIQVLCNGNVLATVGVTPAAVDPAIFTQTGTGTGAGSIVNLNGTVNTASNPISPGSYISVYVTGFGTYNPPGSDGLERMTFPVTATIGGIAANVIYAGEAPGETSGLQQINIQIPANVTLGPSVPIILTVDGVGTQAGVTVAIQ